MRRLALPGIAVLCLAAPAFADSVLFFNGLPNFGTNGSNFLDCSTCRASGGVDVYDNFSVGGNGWQVTSLFGNFEFFTASPLPTTASWSITTGISQGVYGTTVASGVASITLTPFTTPAGGNTSFTYEKATVTIPTLTLSAGSYWLMLAPASAANESFLIGTDGTGGTNPVIDGQSYVTGPYWPTIQNIGAYEQPFSHSSSYDFSYGVSGTQITTPEPHAWAAASLALIGVIFIAWRRVNYHRGGVLTRN